MTINVPNRLKQMMVLDFVVGGLTIAILLGGLFMLFSGISAFGDKGK